MGVIGELPVGSQARIKTGSGVGIVVEEQQSLVGVLQNDVVGGILLLLQVQVVDVSGGADDKRVLMSGNGVVGRGRDRQNAQCHHEAQEQCKCAFFHVFLLTVFGFLRTDYSILYIT